MKKKKYENWQVEYDPELDTLYVTPGFVGKKYRLLNMGGDIDYYVNKNGKIGGLMIEYFRTNVQNFFNKNKGLFRAMDRAEQARNRKSSRANPSKKATNVSRPKGGNVVEKGKE